MSPRRLVSTPKRLVTLTLIAVIAAIGLPTGAVLVSAQSNDNCNGIHKLVVTLDTMIGNSRSQVEKYESEGLLSHAQVQRALREQDENRRLLAGADCK